MSDVLCEFILYMVSHYIILHADSVRVRMKTLYWVFEHKFTLLSNVLVCSCISYSYIALSSGWFLVISFLVSPAALTCSARPRSVLPKVASSYTDFGSSEMLPM